MPGLDFPRPEDAHYLRDVHDQIQGQLMNEGIDREVRQWASEQVRAARPLLDRTLRGEDGFEDFLYTYLQREHDRWQAASAEDSPYDSVRTTPLCTCADARCPLKRGELPASVRTADATSEGLTSFVRGHTGLPIVLVGQPGTEGQDGAREAWAQQRGAAGHLLRTVRMHLTRDQEAVPDVNPADDLDREATTEPIEVQV